MITLLLFKEGFYFFALSPIVENKIFRWDNSKCDHLIVKIKERGGLNALSNCLGNS